jgi:hypothetical protein
MVVLTRGGVFEPRSIGNGTRRRMILQQQKMVCGGPHVHGSQFYAVIRGGVRGGQIRNDKRFRTHALHAGTLRRFHPHDNKACIGGGGFALSQKNVGSFVRKPKVSLCIPSTMDCCRVGLGCEHEPASVFWHTPRAIINILS